MNLPEFLIGMDGFQIDVRDTFIPRGKKVLEKRKCSSIF